MSASDLSLSLCTKFELLLDFCDNPLEELLSNLPCSSSITSSCSSRNQSIFEDLSDNLAGFCGVLCSSTSRKHVMFAGVDGAFLAGTGAGGGDGITWGLFLKMGILLQDYFRQLLIYFPFFKPR